ncbi:uncharacterized protein LOC128549273 [Mercenaria mercenaria]|uniref:uncharacterized protein LOC128549273 n=1 Tax=Mercenaria mercenaria TaxID=6596 RepID=UPI00234E7BAC|nr:uncharacterized protein LOC128549273 [Mercenaria mercenaria]
MAKECRNSIKWESDEPVKINTSLEIDYDVMFVTALYERAHFVIDAADNFGLEFVVPVDANDNGYFIFLTNVNDKSVDVRIHGSEAKVVGPNKTEVVAKSDFSQHSSVIHIDAKDEISVYVFRNLSSGKAFGHSVLPVDILGPSYHLFLDSTLDTNETAENVSVCTGYAIEDNTESNVGPVGPVPVSITKEMYDKELGHQKLLTANRPMAIFCGADDNRAQMPPRETLGKQHYIPPLNLDSTEKAEIRLVATEDSTIVIIRGNYDHLDTISLTGITFCRAVENDMLYDINSTKPIQVHLQMRSKDLSWASVVVIPPVEQYKSEHVFPGINSIGSRDHFEIVYVY